MEKYKQAGIAILIAHRASFKEKLIKKGYHILIRGTLQQENIMIVNIYEPNIRTPNFIKIEP